MSRKNNKFFLIVSLAFALSAVLTLGACSKKVVKEAEEEQVTTEAGAMTEGEMSAEEREQMGQRDVGYASEPALEDVHFDFDKSDIRPDAREILAVNAEWIKNHPDAKIQIEGHCDERGTEEYNLALGERRANAVKNYIISLGIEAERLYTISYGEELPLDPGHDEAAWAKNRRAHFLVTR